MRDQLERKLLAAARLGQPDVRVPHAFETRILAAIRGRAAADPWLAWSRVLTRAAVTCVGISMVLSVWFYWANGPEPEPPDLEHAVLAALDHPGGGW